MDMGHEQTVADKLKVSPFLVFFLIHSMQMGIGVLGFQRIIALTAGYDAWISVIFAGLSIHLILWMVYKIAETVNGDMVSVHTYIYGKKAGKLLSLPFVLYFCLLAITILNGFIEVIQVWMFQDLSRFWFTVAFLGLVIYIIYGGFRTVTGIAFFGVTLPLYLILTFFFTFPYADLSNLLPIFDHPIKDLLKASYNMSLTYLGWETLLFYYPFIKDPAKSKKWAHGAVLFTTFLYTILSVVTFAYFSERQLQKNIWATLTMWKIVQMPFVERFEYIGIANWNIVILPNLCIAIWCASRLLKRTMNIKQKKGVLIVTLICLIGGNIFKTRDQINTLINLSGIVGFYLNYVYIPLLFVAVMIIKKVKKQ